MGPLPGHLEVSSADIYRWQDDSGVFHFTDTPSHIPEKYRSRRKMVQQVPADSGRPSVSTMESPPRPPAAPPPEIPPPVRPDARPGEASSPAPADELQAKITAKERFIEGIDRKRSHTRNPMGNRFVSQEDLDLYKKYSEELPQDRQRLKELQGGAP